MMRYDINGTCDFCANRTLLVIAIATIVVNECFNRDGIDMSSHELILCDIMLTSPPTTERLRGTIVGDFRSEDETFPLIKM